MSPRPRKTEPIEVVETSPGVVSVTEEKPLDQVHTEAEIAEVKAQADVEDQSLEEFNVHIQTLVRNFVQQETAGLEQRIKDLEMLVGNPDTLQGIIGPPEPLQGPTLVGDVPDYLRDPHTSDDVPEYNSAHQDTGDGVPFYRA
jgi:hypothetical protein